MEVEPNRQTPVYSAPPVGALRSTELRPTYKLSVKLLDTYKFINKVYYEAKAKKQRETAKTSGRGGVLNDGYDDQNYDYIIQTDEMIFDRYVIRYRMGKGSFGQVVCAYDTVKKVDVAIKIIKSRKPFFVQAKTEMEILSKILESDPNDERHFVRMIHDFVFRSHQCFVFELLSYNLYELLRNTKFRGVSLNLIRKFTIQLLRALDLLSKPDVNIIHCDIKPENILLRHPRRSAIKLIDFGSSCYANKRTYTYIQSRFYRSPEVMLGLPYTQKIDMWSLGCVLVEMHTGEPLFGGSNQVDQMCRIIDVFGMPPLDMIKASPSKMRSLFFERVQRSAGAGTNVATSSNTGSSSSAASTTIDTVLDFDCTVLDDDDAMYVLKRPSNFTTKHQQKLSLAAVIGVYSGGPHGRRAQEANHTVARYEEFLDFIGKLLVFDPSKRAAPVELFEHPYLVLDDDPSTTTSSTTAASANNTSTTTSATAAAVSNSTNASTANTATNTATSTNTSTSANSG